MNRSSNLLDKEVSVDINRLQQILMNLINNALKFTDHGFVKIVNKLEGENLYFSVEDTGIGIDSSKFDRIFEPFGQVEDIEKNYGGTGLGLAICKRLLDLMGGKLEVYSTVGEGTMFWFTVPLKFADSNEKLLVKHFEDNSKQQKDQYNTDYDGKLILVVDDVPHVHSFFDEILSDTNVKIEHCLRAEDAIEMCVSNKHIDLILMDLQLPGIDGYEATLIIKQLRPEIPIIAQSANALVGDSQRAFLKGCDDYLSKPINVSEFFDKLNFFLKGL